MTPATDASTRTLWSASQPTAAAVAERAEATLAGDGQVVLREVVTDTRHLTPGALFVALRGERFDGHDFVPAAWAAGASAVLVEQPLAPPPGRAVLQVDDALLAYGRLGRFCRDQFDGPVVGITGSVGKSSTKDVTTAVLAARLNVLGAPKSYNNEIGLPATLLMLQPRHEALVLELAMRGSGQIAYLCDLAAPTIGVLTNIGTSHLELLGSREAIAAAKGELIEALGPDGIAVLNADDSRVMALADRHRGRSLRYGLTPSSDVHATDVALLGLEGSRFRLHTPAGSAPVTLRLAGRHMVSNALAAAAVGVAAGLDVEAIAAGLAAAQPAPLRQEVVTAPNGARVLNDAYNAAPDSVRAALSVLATEPCQGRRIAVLGDMLELGAETVAEHERLGQAIAASETVDVLVGVGDLGAVIAEAARRAGLATAEVVADPEAAGAWLVEQATAGDLVLLKASRAVALERALERALAEWGATA